MRTTFLIVILTAFYSVSSALAALAQDRVQGTFLGCRLGEDFRSVSNPERWECRGFNFKPLQYGISPFCLYNFGSTPWWPLQVGYAKVMTGDIPATFSFIRKTLSGLDPSFNTGSMDVRFLDDAVAGLYAQEDRLVRMITTASWISLLMLNRYYLRITTVCFAVAVPVAWFIIRRWVSSFPYQSPVPVWIFLVALVLVSLITAVTVTLQSRRAALRNPVDSISSE